MFKKRKDRDESVGVLQHHSAQIESPNQRILALEKILAISEFKIPKGWNTGVPEKGGEYLVYSYKDGIIEQRIAKFYKESLGVPISCIIPWHTGTIEQSAGWQTKDVICWKEIE